MSMTIPVLASLKLSTLTCMSYLVEPFAHCAVCCSSAFCKASMPSAGTLAARFSMVMVPTDAAAAVAGFHALIGLTGSAHAQTTSAAASAAVIRLDILDHSPNLNVLFLNNSRYCEEVLHFAIRRDNSGSPMLTRMTQFSVVALVVLTGCHISDAPTSKAAAPDVLSSDAGSVRISGLSQFHQTALVVTDACRTFKYETDRQAAARATIDQTLGSQASGLPGGLQLTVESLSLRMRCHTAGAGALSSYCAAEASLALAATAKDRNGQAISVTASKDATAQVAVG